MSLPAGARLGHYEIVAALGAGAMGEVYRARDTRLRRDVAIKLLPGAVRDDPDRLARFAREAQALAALNHPHIAAVYGLEQDTTAGAAATGPSAPPEFDWWSVSLEGDTEPTPTGVYGVLQARGLSGTEENNTPRPSPDVFPGAWTADGILFAARLGQGSNLWRVRVAEDTGRVVPDSLQRLTSGAGDDVEPSGSAGALVAFTVMSPMAVSLTLPLDANVGVTRGPVERHSAEAFFGSGGRNSLDDSGRWLVYPKQRVDESEIWLKDLTTGDERHLATTPPSQLNPVISRDGRLVAYGIPEATGNAGYVMPIDGGTARKVCVPCVFAGWFPDNRRISIIVRPAAQGTQRPEGTVQALNVFDGRHAARPWAIPSWSSTSTIRDVTGAPRPTATPSSTARSSSIRSSRPRACG